MTTTQTPSFAIYVRTYDRTECIHGQNTKSNDYVTYEEAQQILAESMQEMEQQGYSCCPCDLGFQAYSRQVPGLIFSVFAIGYNRG
jgi:hypothetical protein